MEDGSAKTAKTAKTAKKLRDRAVDHAASDIAHGLASMLWGAISPPRNDSFWQGTLRLKDGIAELAKVFLDAGRT